MNYNGCCSGVTCTVLYVVVAPPYMAKNVELLMWLSACTLEYSVTNAPSKYIAIFVFTVQGWANGKFTINVNIICWLFTRRMCTFRTYYMYVCNEPKQSSLNHEVSTFTNYISLLLQSSPLIIMSPSNNSITSFGGRGTCSAITILVAHSCTHASYDLDAIVTIMHGTTYLHWKSAQDMNIIIYTADAGKLTCTSNGGCYIL